MLIVKHWSLRSSSDKMASFTFLFQIALAAIIANTAYGSVNHVPLPTINLTEWWGPGNGATGDDTTIYNYTIQFNATMIADLRSRLTNARSFVPPLEGVAFNYGFNSTTLKHWMKYLAEEYPFAARQTYLNQFSHYKTMIQGLKIHFMRVTTQNTTNKIVPLLIVHGWPGSFREFYETIPYLLSYSKAQGFGLDIIIPSLPGFGFSDGAVRPGMGVDKVAVILRNLMHRLNYSTFFIQGGDLGGMITSNMATMFPEEIIGYHTNFCLLHTPEIIFNLILGNYHQDEITEPELQSRLYPSWTKFFGIMTATGYLHIQATKPDTVGIGLSDSPAGLMAYTLEKVSTAVRKKFINYTDGGLTEILTAEQIFDNYMIYWSSNCITTAVRIYSETFNKRYVGLRMNEIRSPVPTWVSQAPDEIIYLPVWMIKKKFPNVINSTLPVEGGHFYAWEKPELFAENVVEAIVAFNKWHAMNSTLYTNCSMYISD